MASTGNTLRTSIRKRRCSVTHKGSGSHNSNSDRVGLTYFDTNLGFIDIDWSPPSPLIRLQVRDEKGGGVLQQRVRLSDLQSSER